ncbi:hypothetical protein [Winogradskyella sp.]|uniref:hypothetical protein n=1 Tax=Winogradskyella sp. TaxID=1883156 RepID=UPI0026237942|nr:hypothetical protein [Winogradskyella sp.]
MKNSIVILLTILFLNPILKAQNFKVGDLVKLSNTVPVINSSIDVYSDDANNVKVLNFLESGVIFRVVDISDTEVKVIALPFEVKTGKQKKNFKEKKPDEKIKSEYYNDKVYSISLKNFNAFAVSYVIPDRISVGLLTLPFRARPQDDFSFHTEFNLSTAVNFKLGSFKGSTFNWQFGAGISSVGLNSENSLGIESGESQDVATLTLFTGPMLQYKKVQIGLYLGVDQINNQSNYQWKSNGNLWLGFGVGFDVFSVSVSTPKNGQ